MRDRFRLGLIAAVITASLFAGCGGGGSTPAAPPGPRPTPSSLPTSPITFSSDQGAILTAIGQTYQFSASGPGPVSYTSNNPAAVSVTANGNATALTGNGSAIITVASGSAVAYASVLIDQPGSNTVVVPSSSVISATAASATLSNTPVTATIKAGNIVVSGDKGGLLATVQSVTVSSTQVQLITAPASLGAAFPHLNVSLSLTTPNISGSTSIHREQLKTAVAPQSISFSAFQCTGSLADKATGISLRFTSLQLNPFVDYNADQESLRLGLKPVIAANASTSGAPISASASDSCSSSAIEALPIIPLGPILIGGSVTLTLAVKLTATGAITTPTIGSTFSLSPTIAVDITPSGITTDSANLTPTVSVNPDAFTTPITKQVSLDANASARFDVGVAVNVGRFVNILNAQFFFLKPEVDWNSNISSTVSSTDAQYTGPNWATKADVAYGVEAGFNFGAVTGIAKYFGIPSGNVDQTLFDPVFNSNTSPVFAASAVTSSDGCSVSLGATGLTQEFDLPDPPTVNWLAFTNSATTGRIVSSNVATGGSAAGIWKVGPSDDGTYSVSAQTSGSIFASIGLPYASNTSAPTVTVNVPQACSSPSPSPSPSPTSSPAGPVSILITDPNPADGLQFACYNSLGIDEYTVNPYAGTILQTFVIKFIGQSVSYNFGQTGYDSISLGGYDATWASDYTANGFRPPPYFSNAWQFDYIPTAPPYMHPPPSNTYVIQGGGASIDLVQPTGVIMDVTRRNGVSTAEYNASINTFGSC